MSGRGACGREAGRQCARVRFCQAAGRLRDRRGCLAANLQAIRSAELKAVKGADTQAKTQPTGPEKASSETADSSSAADASALVLADKASGHSPLSRHLAERERPLLADVARVEGSKQDVEVSMQDVEGAVSDGDGEVAFEGESTLAERNARLLAEAVDVESVPYHRIRKAPNPT